MKEYTVSIKETLEMYVNITASSSEEAVDKVKAAWKDGKHILDYENFQCVDFAIVKGK